MERKEPNHRTHGAGRPSANETVWEREHETNEIDTNLARDKVQSKNGSNTTSETQDERSRQRMGRRMRLQSLVTDANTDRTSQHTGGHTEPGVGPYLCGVHERRAHA